LPAELHVGAGRTDHGADGRQLLKRSTFPQLHWRYGETRRFVQLLRQVWVQQFVAVEPAEAMRWRTAEELPPARC